MATKAGLHWFWRGAITVLLSAGCNFLIVIMTIRVADFSTNASAAIMCGIVMTTLPAAVIYGLLSHHFGPAPSDGELHCRKCEHILRGLSEPRCPECGEPI